MIKRGKDEFFSDREAAKRRDEVVRRMATTHPTTVAAADAVSDDKPQDPTS
jgi:hypothetical protein